jgi:hypothetical protein
MRESARPGGWASSRTPGTSRGNLVPLVVPSQNASMRPSRARKPRRIAAPRIPNSAHSARVQPLHAARRMRLAWLSLLLLAPSLASACSRAELDAELSPGSSSGGPLVPIDDPLDADTAADAESSDGARATTTSPTCTAPTAPIQTSEGPSNGTPFPLGTCIGSGLPDSLPSTCCPADQFPLRCLPPTPLPDGGPGQPVPPPFDLSQCSGCTANIFGENISSTCCCPCIDAQP